MRLPSRASPIWSVCGVRAGRFDAALNHLNQALKSQPNNPLLYEQIGDVYVLEGNSNAARSAYEAALQHSPDDRARKRIRRQLHGK